MRKLWCLWDQMTHDPIVRLAIALNASRGAYAVLLGSGLSAAAGVPTGGQIVADLIAKVAALEGKSVGSDAYDWYRNRFGEEPEYSKLLDELAASSTERNELLRTYFEPGGFRAPHARPEPTAAHRALARLAAHGYISVFLTTNFDRLLEHALHAAGVSPTVLASPDDLEGSLPLGRTRCLLVKLNGDYLDTRIKNTSQELESYHPTIERLLDRILDEYGLIVCGWSADWDTALCRAIERNSRRRYTTFWASRGPLAGAAARIVAARDADVIQIKDADSLFADLSGRLALLDPRFASTDGERAIAASRLPARTASFIGRKAELEQIAATLEDPPTRLLTLVGPGGTGKTALAIQAAQRVAPQFRDGVIFVALSNARESSAVLVAIIRTLGLGEDMEQPVEALIAHLRPRHLLLVLDNFEQVIDAADLVARLLAGCPDLHVLVTSRQSLNIQGERLYRVPPLALPAADGKTGSAKTLQDFEAVQLFVDRAKAVRPDFVLTDANAHWVAEICRRLDGLPLAIELAAAWVRLFSPEQLMGRLQERLGLLNSGPRDLPDRQRTLRATMEWSFDLLEPDEQRLLELLALFRGADLDAVEAVVSRLEGSGAFGKTRLDVLELLSSLMEKSMVERLESPQGELRIVLLQTVQEYALDRLEGQGELSAQGRRAHAGYYADRAHQMRQELSDDRRDQLLERMAAEAANLRVAWRYWASAGDLSQLEKLADGMLTLAESRGWCFDIIALTTDMVTILAEKGSSPDEVDQEMALRTSLVRALLASKGYTPEVENAFTHTIEVFERSGDTGRQFSALRGLSYLYSLRGSYREAAETAKRLLGFAEREHEPAMLIEAHLRAGVSKVFGDDLRAGLDHLDRAIALFPAVGLHGFPTRGAGSDPRVACYTSSAFALWLLGQPQQVVARVDAALALASELDQAFTLAFAYFHAGLMCLLCRDFEGGIAHVRMALKVAETHDLKIWTATGTALSGALQIGLGRAQSGMADLDTGMALYKGLRSPPVFWPVLLWMQATACLRAGRPAEGLPPLEMAMQIMGTGTGSVLSPEFHLLKGDLLDAVSAHGAGEGGQGEQWYRLAVDGAEVRNARMSQLRAASRLCRCLRGRPGEDTAAKALEEILETFPRDSTTPDIAEARELLLEHARTARERAPAPPGELLRVDLRSA